MGLLDCGGATATEKGVEFICYLRTEQSLWRVAYVCIEDIRIFERIRGKLQDCIEGMFLFSLSSEPSHKKHDLLSIITIAYFVTDN